MSPFRADSRTARKPSTEQLVTALVFHQLQPAGTLANHSTRLHGIRMSDSACAQRRQNLPVELFEQIMDSALGPLAIPAHHAESFFEGYRLLGIDGTQWSVTNTPAVVEALPKAASRRFSAAFAKLRLVSVVELGTHAPVAAVAAPVSETEQALAQQLWARVPSIPSLSRTVRLEHPRPCGRRCSVWGDRDITFLVRVRDNINSEVEQRLPDGSAFQLPTSRRVIRQIT